MIVAPDTTAAGWDRARDQYGVEQGDWARITTANGRTFEGEVADAAPSDLHAYLDLQVADTQLPGGVRTVRVFGAHISTVEVM